MKTTNIKDSLQYNLDCLNYKIDYNVIESITDYLYHLDIDMNTFAMDTFIVNNLQNMPIDEWLDMKILYQDLSDDNSKITEFNGEVWYAVWQ